MKHAVVRLFALLALASASTTGCYLAHERSGPRPAVLDAFVADSAVPPPECRIRCDRAELIASTLLPLGAPSTTLVTALVVDGVPFVLVNTNAPGEAFFRQTAYLPYRFDAASGEVLGSNAPGAPRTSHEVSAANLRLVDGTLRVIGLETAEFVRDIRTGLAVFSTAGDVLSEFEPLATAPFLLEDDDSSSGTVFGRDGRDIVAFTQGTSVHAWDLRLGATDEPALLSLVSLRDDGGRAPVSGAILDDGRVVLAGGGTQSQLFGAPTPLARAPFLALGSLAEAPLPARPIAGLRSDPPPLVVAESPGFALVRFIAEAGDLARSTIHIMHADADGTTRVESQIRTTGGRRPLGTFAFAGRARVGVAWSEVAPDSMEVDLRVVPAGADDRCETIEAGPFARVFAEPSALVAAASDDGTTYVAVLLVRPTDDLNPRLDLYRVPSCTIER